MIFYKKKDKKHKLSVIEFISVFENRLETWNWNLIKKCAIFFLFKFEIQIMDSENLLANFHCFSVPIMNRIYVCELIWEPRMYRYAYSKINLNLKCSFGKIQLDEKSFIN